VRDTPGGFLFQAVSSWVFTDRGLKPTVIVEATPAEARASLRVGRPLLPPVEE